MTVRYEPSRVIRKPVVDGRGQFVRYDETENTLKPVEFSWTVLCETGEQAAEVIRRRGYFLNGLDAKCTCRVGRVALLDAPRPADILSEQERREALAMGHGCWQARAAAERIGRIVMRLKEAVAR